MTDQTYEEGWAAAIEAACGVAAARDTGHDTQVNREAHEIGLALAALRPPAPPEPLLRSRRVTPDAGVREASAAELEDRKHLYDLLVRSTLNADSKVTAVLLLNNFNTILAALASTPPQVTP